MCSSDLALRDITFTIKKGETVGIIGESGAGKSTLMDILIGLLTPSKGTIVLDGTPLDSEQVQGWAKLTGYIPQSPYIIDGTLAENIAFGENSDEISMDRLKIAASQAGILHFLPSLEAGYDSIIGERGVRLSGGQQQRVCIARALYKQPDVLVLDRKSVV